MVGSLDIWLPTRLLACLPACLLACLVSLAEGQPPTMPTMQASLIEALT